MIICRRKLCLVYLGGVLPDKFSRFKAQSPLAHDHARWMFKLLRILTLAMPNAYFFRDIEIIQSLALLCSIVYTRGGQTF